MMKGIRAPVTWTAPLSITNSALVATFGAMTQAQKNQWIAKGGGLIVGTLRPTVAEMIAMATAPMTIAPAPGVGFRIVPFFFVATQALGAVIFGSARSYQIEFAGQNIDPIATAVAVINTANVFRRTWVCVDGAGDNWGVNTENMAVELIANLNTSGGSGTFKYEFVYAVVPVV